MTSHDEQLAETFVQLADTLVDDFDVIEFLHTLIERCIELLDLDAAGLLLADHDQQLQLTAAVGSQTAYVEFIELDYQDGPGQEAFRSARAVSYPDLPRDANRWPRFATAAAAASLCSAYAVPIRLRTHPIGALTLFSRRRGAIAMDQLRVAQSLADIAAVGILHERAVREQQLLVEQLETALNTRIVIQQAKGILAERRHCGPEEAFAAMRRFARDRNWHLTHVAQAVIADAPSVAPLAGPASH